MKCSAIGSASDIAANSARALPQSKEDKHRSHLGTCLHFDLTIAPLCMEVQPRDQEEQFVLNADNKEGVLYGGAAEKLTPATNSSSWLLHARLQAPSAQSTM